MFNRTNTLVTFALLAIVSALAMKITVTKYSYAEGTAYLRKLLPSVTADIVIGYFVSYAHARVKVGFSEPTHDA